MTNKEVTDYIIQCRNLGFKDSHIRRELINHGHDGLEVDRAFESADYSGNHIPKIPSHFHQEKSSNKIYIWVGVIIAIVVIIALIIFFNRKYFIYQSDNSIDANEVFNCGIASSNLEEVSIREGDQTTTTLDYSKDNARICIGEKMLKCEKSIIKLDANSESYLEVLGKDGNNCNIKVNYGNVESEDLEMVRNKELTCPPEISSIPSYGCLLSSLNCPWYGDPGFVAGGIESALSTAIIFSAYSGEEPSCSGEFSYP